MNCSCSVNSDYDGEGSHWGVQARRAAKVHKCYECGDEIAKGEFYTFHTVFGDSYIGNYKVCFSCNFIMYTFFSNGWLFGSVLEDLREYLHESWQEDLPSDCISKLPSKAQAFVCDYLQEYQEE